MPLLDPNDDQLAQGPRGAIPQQQPDPAASSSVFDLLDAADRRSNLIGTAYERFTNPKPDAPAIPDFDPSGSVPPGYESVADVFAGATSPQDVEWRRQQFDREQQANAIIKAHGGWGLAASMAFGAVDPVTLASMAIPVAGETRLIQAGRMALASGVGSAGQELGMHALEVSRTPEQSALNVAASTVLGGVLGGIIRPHVPLADFTEIADRYHQELHGGDPGETVMGPIDGRQPIIPPQEGGKAAPGLTDKFRGELTADHAAAVEQYRALDNPEIADTQGGKILNVDMARELSPEYAADRTLSADVHEPASEFVKKMYTERLAEQPKEGELPTVLFTAGGTGAGKSSAIEGALGPIAERAQIIYDTNMNSEASAASKIDQALDAGKDVHIAYVYRDPAEALTNGALPRAERMGRTVPLENHAETHAGSFETINKLQERYKDNPSVQFSIIDNSRGKGKQALSSMENLEGKRYNVPIEELRNALDSERQAGRISEATYRGTLGENTRTAESDRGVSLQDRPGVGGQPEAQHEGPLSLPEVPQGILENHVNPNAESTAGAAQVSNPTIRGEAFARGAQTLSKTLGKVSPGSRLMDSASIKVRQLIQEMANLPETLEKNWQSVASASPIERELWKLDGVHNQGIKARNMAFLDYKKRLAGTNEAPLTRWQFTQEIAYAMRRDDESMIPEVSKAARQSRAIELEPLKQRAMNAQRSDGTTMLPKDVKAQGAMSYLMRQYDHQKINADMSGWLDRLTQGFRNQGVDAAEARDIAYQVTRNVQGSERGTMDWNTMDGIVPESGQLKERTLKLPDELLEPYLNNDVDHVLHSYLRSMGPEVEMTERFGSRDMRDQIGDVKDEYARMMEREETNAGKAAIYSKMDADLRDLTAVRDRLYGIYGQPKDPGHFAVRAGRVLRSVNALRLLGGATLAHFPDMANVMMKYGLPKTLQSIGRVLTSKEAFNLTREEAKRMGAGLDMAMNATASMLGDYATHSQYAEQRIANKLTRGFTILTGETPLITAVQQLTSTMAQDEIIRSAQTIAKGGKIDPALSARLAGAGLDRDMLTGIAAQHEKFGAQVNGLNFGMSDKWKNQVAARAFESAILRDAHSVTLRPGVGDTPLFMSGEWGKALRQFTTFGFAAQRSVVNPLMQGLAHGDPRAAQALFALAAMGTLSYVAKQKAAGQPIEPWNSPRFALEVLDKSNLMGWTSDLVFPALWMMGLKSLSRWSDRDPIETIGGPSAGTIAATYKQQLPAKALSSIGIGSASNKGVSRTDLHFVRRLMPAQNLWYMRNHINNLEDAVGNAFNLPGKSNADRAAENISID
jgi:hypothetical protein